MIESRSSRPRKRFLAPVSVLLVVLVAAVGPTRPTGQSLTTAGASVPAVPARDGPARVVPRYLFTAPYLSELLDVSPNGEKVLYEAFCRRQGRPPCGGDPRSRMYVYDRTTRSRRLVSVTSDGRGRPVGGTVHAALFLGNDKVLFDAMGPGLVDDIDRYQVELYVKNLRSGGLRLVSRAPHGAPAHGRGLDLYSTDATTGTVAFGAYADNLAPDVHEDDTYHLYVKTLRTGALDRVDYGRHGRPISGIVGEDDCDDALLAPGGGKVALTCYSPHMTAHDTNRASDCFVRDLRTGAVHRASVSAHGQQFRLNTWCESIAPAGTRVLMRHDAPMADPEPHENTYLKDLRSSRLELVFDGESDVDPSWRYRVNLYPVSGYAQYAVTTLRGARSRWVTRNQEGHDADHGARMARKGRSFADSGRVLVFSTTSTNLAHRVQRLTTDFYLVRP